MFLSDNTSTDHSIWVVSADPLLQQLFGPRVALQVTLLGALQAFLAVLEAGAPLMQLGVRVRLDALGAQPTRPFAEVPASATRFGSFYSVRSFSVNATQFVLLLPVRSLSSCKTLAL